MTKTTSAVVVACFLLLNVYFAWTSGLLRAISISLFSIVNAPIQWQKMVLWTDLDLAKVSEFTYIVIDIECFILLIILMASCAWLNRGRGLGTMTMRATQVASFCLVIFGVELGLFDCSEFFIHVTDFQVSLNFLPWFSNADMLITSLAILISSTLLLDHSRLEARWARSALVSQISHRLVVDRRDLDRFLIFSLFGILFIIGGGVLAYYEGVWRLSYSDPSSAAGSVISAHYLLTSYSECRGQLRFVSGLASDSSCSFYSFNLGELAFLGLGIVSILGGQLALRKQPSFVTGDMRGLLRMLTLVMPVLGGVFGHVMVTRDKNKPSGTNMIILGIETLLMFAFILNSVHFMGSIGTPACSNPASAGYGGIIP
jgi:hypothetical protein